MKHLLSFNLLVLLLSFSFPSIAAAQNDSIMVSSADVKEPSLQGWISIKDKTITVWYLPDANLKRLEARLRERDIPMTQEYHELLSNRNLSIQDRLMARFEIILLRVEDILGMDPKDFQVKIRIFKTRHDMNDAYTLMFNDSINFKSFYIHYFRSVYTNEQDFIDSIIAHELGHAVIDTYFALPPPSRMAELMATYVDAHLDQND